MTNATVEQQDQTTNSLTANLLKMDEIIKQKMSFRKQRDSMLRQVGVIGKEKQSLYLFACLLVGEPFVEYGSSGTGKTWLAKQTEKYFYGGTGVFIDSAKVNFEEVQGPYNLRKYFDQNKIEYLVTPQTLAGKDLLFIDELTRAKTDVMNGLLEITADKTLNGMRLPQLKAIIAACNPLSYEGTNPLTEALADRFLFCVEAEDLISMSEEDNMLITEQGSVAKDQVLMNWIDGFQGYTNKYPDLTKEFQAYMQKVGKMYLNVKKKFKIHEYVVKFARLYEGDMLSKNLAESGLYYRIQGRRVNLLRDGITAVLSILLMEYEEHLKTLSKEEKAKFKLSKEEMDYWIRSSIFQAVLSVVNVALTGKEVKIEMLQDAHQIALSCIDSNEYNSMYDITTEGNLTKRFWKALVHHDEQPLALSPAFELIKKNFKYDDSATYDRPVYDMDKLLGLDSFIPLLFLADPKSIFYPIFDNLEEDIKLEINEHLKMAYTPICATLIEDYTKEVQDYSLRKHMRSVGMKDRDDYGQELDKILTHDDVYKPEFNNLSKEEQMLREVIFRTNAVDQEIDFSKEVALQGLHDFCKEVRTEKEVNAILAKREEVLAEKSKQLDGMFQYKLQKVMHEYELIKEVVRDSDFAHLLNS